MVAKILPVIVAFAILGTVPALAASAVGSDLGKDLSGESCHLQNKDIICGKDENAVGLLWAAEALSLPSDAAGREARLLAAAQSVPGNGLENATCDGTHPLGGDNLLFACTVRDTGRPEIILVSANAHGLWGAEGLPAMLPVLEAAIAVSSGDSLSSTQSAAAQTVLQAKFSIRVLQASAADFSDYLKVIDQGRQEG